MPHFATDGTAVNGGLPQLGNLTLHLELFERDFAAMIPMLEMAGAERIRYIKELLYVYNCSNPGSMHKEKKSHEAQTLNHIRVVRSDCYPLYEDRIPK